MVKKALLIGINYIGTSNELNGCINDVANMKKYLTSKGYMNIAVLTDDLEDNMKPSYVNIYNYIKWLVRDCTKGDELFLHYSGHGTYMTDTNGDEEDGRDEALVPCDYDTKGMIVDDLLRKWLVDAVIPGVNLFCVFDCCHSGTMLDLRYKCRINERRMEKKGIIYDTLKRVFKSSVLKVKKNREYAVSKANIIMISGCKDSQTSADAWMKEEKSYSGALTYYLLEVLKERPHVTYNELLKEVRNRLRVNQYEQIPQITYGNDINLNGIVKI